PLALSFERVPTRGGSDRYVARTSPVDVAPQVLGVAGGCCSCETNGPGFVWSCAEGCTCGGYWHDLAVTAAWEGYARPFSWTGRCPCNSPTGQHATAELECVDTLFNVADPAHDKFNELSPVVVRLGSTGSIVSGYLLYPGDKIKLWDSPDRARQVASPRNYTDVSTPREETLWMEAAATSDDYEDIQLSLTWTDDAGRSGNVVQRLTAVCPNAEPVCAQAKQSGDLSVFYNPSCISRDGSDAWYRISWIPTTYPSSRVVWSSTVEGVSFKGGNLGNEVCVHASADAASAGLLRVKFGNALEAEPTFGFRVVDPKRIRMYIIPVVESEDESPPSVSDREYEILDRVYSQVGIAFNVVAKQKLVFSDVRAIKMGDRSSISGLRDPEGTANGLVVFVSGHPIIGCAAFTCGIGDRHIVLGSYRRETTLAHETGHALGLRDIYVDSRESPYARSTTDALKVERLTDETCFAEMADWNFGKGPSYYPSGMSHADIIRRFLMYGKGSARGDIPISAVWGVTIDRGPKEMFVPVGFENLVLQPECIDNGGGE
ncbi:MAG: hypothetical protein IJ829_02305, partial [Kiritimatiellae bacterium]|nr:hypothetical protein [Kiritimatiellia bacterium]